MVVETTRFGIINVDEADVLSFPEGMLGFSKIDRYVLVERTDDSLVLWLQALKKPTVAFPLLEPEIFEKNYKIELMEDDQKVLSLGDDIEKTKVFAIITIPSDPTKMTANLKAPIVINLDKKLAKQVILHNQDYPIRKSIFADLQNHCQTQQRTIFPASESSTYQTIHLTDTFLPSVEESAV